MLIHKPSNVKPLDTIYAVLTRDAEGNEGICGGTFKGGNMFACVSGDLDIALRYFGLAKKLQSELGTAIVLRSYSKANDLEVSEP